MSRLVVKVGTAVLSEQNRVAKERMENLVALIAKLVGAGEEVILVSSGAVAAGYSVCPLDKKVVANRQALAAIGQPKLVSMYQKRFERYDIHVAQMLLTADDFDSRKRTRHARCAIETLLKQGIVPIINENDVTATEELVFGDNDQLSAHVAFYFGADLLAILSDIDAYYDKDPRKHSDARALAHVAAIPEEALVQAYAPNAAFATGGIVTKLKAADFLLKRERSLYLGSGFDLAAAKAFLLENRQIGGTLFSGDIKDDTPLQ